MHVQILSTDGVSLRQHSLPRPQYPIQEICDQGMTHGFATLKSSWQSIQIVLTAPGAWLDLLQTLAIEPGSGPCLPL